MEREPRQHPAAGPRPAPGAPDRALQGLLERVTYHDEGSLYSVLRILPERGYEAPEGRATFRPERVTAVGRCSGPSAGTRVRLAGRWGSHKTHGLQFEFDSLEVLPPEDREGLVKYLASDRFPGIGPTLAQRIVEYRTEHGGFRSLGELREVEGIGEKRFASLREALQR